MEKNNISPMNNPPHDIMNSLHFSVDSIFDEQSTCETQGVLFLFTYLPIFRWLRLILWTRMFLQHSVCIQLPLKSVFHYLHVVHFPTKILFLERPRLSLLVLAQS